MVKISFIIISVVLIFFISETFAEGNKYKIGWIIPLTGTTADYGESIKNSVELAIEDEKNLFENIENIFEDAQNEPRLGINAFKKLKDINKVDVVVVWGVALCSSLAPLADQYQIPIIGVCVNGEAAKNKEYFILGMNIYEDYNTELIKFLKNKKIKELALIEADHIYINSLVETFKKDINPDIKIVYRQNYPVSDQDFRASLVKIKKLGINNVGVFLYPGQIQTFYKQAKALNMDLFTFGTNVFESKSEIIAANGLMEGSFYSANYVYPDWVVNYEKNFTNSTQLSFGAVSFEIAKILGVVFKGNPKSSADIFSLIKNLPKQKGTASGPYQYTKTDQGVGYIKFPVTMKQITGNGFRNIVK
mgnify:CR=1 FL=1